MERDLRWKLPKGRFEDVPAHRAKTMRAIKGSGNRTTELRLRLALVRAGIRGWKLRPKGLPGSPDFVFEARSLVVFADGCFWHGCAKCNRSRVRTNAKFWEAKTILNRKKDRRVTRRLRQDGWSVMRVWEHDLKDRLESVVARIRRSLEKRAIWDDASRSSGKSV